MVNVFFILQVTKYRLDEKFNEHAFSVVQPGILDKIICRGCECIHIFTVNRKDWNIIVFATSFVAFIQT